MLARSEHCCPRCGRRVSARLPGPSISTPRIAEVLAATAELCGITAVQLTAPDQAGYRVHARQVAFHVACREFGHTPAAVARAAGHDRKTVVYALGRIDLSDPTVRHDIKAVVAAVRGQP